MKTQQQSGRWILLATILGSSMAFIDSSVVNVALPRLQADLNASAANVQWVVEAYALFLGALILVGGSLGDQFGRKRIFGLGVIVFALASAWCGFAFSIEQLIIARALQGIGGAMLTPGSLSIIRASFPSEQRGKAIGLWSGFSAITSALGPVLGGWLVQNASWRWIFFINLPIAVIVLVVLFLHVPESRNAGERSHLDFLGALLTMLGLGGIVFGLIESSSLGLLHPLVLSCVLGGVIALALFIVVEQRSPAPMMPLTLFRSATFSGTNLLTLLLYAAMGGLFFFLPFNLISVQGYTATEAGGSLLPFTLLLFFLSRWSGGLVARYGPKLPLVVGPIIVALGFILFSIPGITSGFGRYWTTYFPAVIVLGIGMAITIAPLTTTVMGAVEDRYAGIASGVNNAVARIAGLLAIAVFGIVVAYTFAFAFDAHLTALHVSPMVRSFMDAQRAKLVGATLPTQADATLRTQLHTAIIDSFLSGFRLIMFISAALALASSLCALVSVSAPKPAAATTPPTIATKRHEEAISGDNACTFSSPSGALSNTGQGKQKDTSR